MAVDFDDGARFFIGGCHMEEIWKNIEGWEGIYQVSNHGRLKSLITGDYTHFHCDSCDKIFPKEQQHKVKVAFTTNGPESQAHLDYTPHYCLICDKCYNRGEK